MSLCCAESVVILAIEKWLMRKNGIFLVIDALRKDVFDDSRGAKALFPNLFELADKGILRPAVANAQATQFVMPSLFSQTYPLDYGGYNAGIRERPRSYAEQLQESGYSTQLMASCNQLGVTHGYERGFDGLHTAQDSRLVLAHFLERRVAYDVERWHSGEISQKEVLGIVVPAMKDLLEIITGIVGEDRGRIWPPKLRFINEQVAQACPHELTLLHQNPLAVLEKIKKIPPILYWRYLGKTQPERFYMWHRLKEAIRWRVERILAKIDFPILFLAHFETKADEVMKGVSDFICRANGPWSIHLHLMDVHDCQSFSRPALALRRLEFLPRWVKSRLRGQTNRRFTYDSALMFVDREIGKLIETLRERDCLENLILLITGDHANYFAESPRPRENVALRTHYEDIDIPMVLYGTELLSKKSGMLDSMGINATYLEALGVPSHKKFKGKSVFSGGRNAIISESAGSGNSDVVNKDLYFTVSTEKYRMMCVMEGSSIEVLKLYDRINDPKELENIVGNPESVNVVKGLIYYLETERREILETRGYDFSSFSGAAAISGTKEPAG